MLKKICFCTTISSTLETFVLPTARALYDTNKYKIYFISTPNKEFENKLPDYITFIPINMKRGIDLSALKSIFLLYKNFKSYHFDIVQYSTPNASLYASIASKYAKIPIRLYAQWGIRYVGFSGVKRKVFKFIEKIICENSTNIRAVSKMNMDFSIKEKLYDIEKVKILGNGGTIGVSLDEFHYEDKERYRKEIRDIYNLNNEFLFGFVGRLSKDKGANELLECLKKLNNKNIKLMCIGPEEENETINKDLLQWAKNSKRVIFTGFIPHHMLERYYATLDCLIHPTYREGFGMALQEAGAMGCPIITTDIPGASEVMENKVSCLLAKPKDVESLYNCMNKLIIDFESRKKIGKAARIRVLELFERNIMIQNQIEDYENL